MGLLMERGGTRVARAVVHEYVDASLLVAVAVLCVVGALGVVVVVGQFGVFEDYVPGVDEAGHLGGKRLVWGGGEEKEKEGIRVTYVAEHEEEDVDY